MPQHNNKCKNVYDRIMRESESYIISCIAYSLYKQNKKELVEETKRNFNRNTLTQKQMDDICNAVARDRNIEIYIYEARNVFNDIYRDISEDILSDINHTFENIIRQQLNEARQNIQNDIEADIDYIKNNILKDIQKKGFWFGVGQNVVAMVIAIIFAFILSISIDFDWKNWINNITSKI